MEAWQKIVLGVAVVIVIIVIVVAVSLAVKKGKANESAGKNLETDESVEEDPEINEPAILIYSHYTLGTDLLKMSHAETLSADSATAKLLKTNWSFVKIGEDPGIYSIKSRVGEKVLNANDDDSIAMIAEDNENKRTQWYVFYKTQTDKDNGKATIRNLATEKCLTISGTIIKTGDCKTVSPLTKKSLNYKVYDDVQTVNINFGKNSLADVNGSLIVRPKGNRKAVWDILQSGNNYLLKNTETENVVEFGEDEAITLAPYDQSSISDKSLFNIVEFGDGKVRLSPILGKTKCLGVVNGEVVANPCDNLRSYWTIAEPALITVSELLPEGGIPAVIIPTYYYTFSKNSLVVSYNPTSGLKTSAHQLNANEAWKRYHWFMVKTGSATGEYMLQSREDGLALASHDDGSIHMISPSQSSERSHWLVYYKSQEAKDLENITLKNKGSGKCLNIVDGLISQGDCGTTQPIKMSPINYKQFSETDDYYILDFSTTSENGIELETKGLAAEGSSLKYMDLAGNVEKMKWTILKSGDNYTIKNKLSQKYITISSVEGTPYMLNTVPHKFNVHHNSTLDAQRIHPINNTYCLGIADGEISSSCNFLWKIIKVL